MTQVDQLKAVPLQLETHESYANDIVKSAEVNCWPSRGRRLKESLEE